MFDRLREADERVVVVAHPDDEVLWCGGLLAKYPGDWTVICCSIPRIDPIRAWKFHNAVETLGAKSVLMPFTEPDPKEHMTDRLKLLQLDNYDFIVTHGKAGEYGHVHHIDIHNYISSKWADKTACFGYSIGSRGKHLLTLDVFTSKVKRRALSCYDHCSPSDKGVPKWKALLNRYQQNFEFDEETYDVCW